MALAFTDLAQPRRQCHSRPHRSRGESAALLRVPGCCIPRSSVIYGKLRPARVPVERFRVEPDLFEDGPLRLEDGPLLKGVALGE